MVCTWNLHFCGLFQTCSSRCHHMLRFYIIDFTKIKCAGKISGFIASIPQVIVAALLVFMWTMLAAMGLSNLRYSETGSSRNVLIVGLALFLSLSIPSFFQQYDSTSSSGLPAYFQPYNVAAHGPFHTSSKPVSFH